MQAERKDLAAKFQALQNVEAEHNKTKGDAAQARTENKNLQGKLKSLQAERQDLAAKIQALQGVEAEHHKTKEDASQFRAENENLQAQLKSLQDVQEGLNANLKTLESQAATVPKITARAQKLAAENESTTQELAEARTEHARVVEQHEQALGKLKEQHAVALAEVHALRCSRSTPPFPGSNPSWSTIARKMSASSNT